MAKPISLASTPEHHIGGPNLITILPSKLTFSNQKYTCIALYILCRGKYVVHYLVLKKFS
jgi:hypothetical protein